MHFNPINTTFLPSTVKSYLPAELQVTAPKGSTKVLTGVKKVTHPPVNTAVNLNLKSPVGGKQRNDSRSEVLGWRCWAVCWLQYYLNI